MIPNRKSILTGAAWMALLFGMSETGASDEARLIFQSGFERESTVVPFRDDDTITGVDRSVEPPNDWEEHLEGCAGFGRFCIQYQGGGPEGRRAEIIPDPTAEGNHVLHFWLKNARTPHGPDRHKGRIQFRAGFGQGIGVDPGNS